MSMSLSFPKHKAASPWPTWSWFPPGSPLLLVRLLVGLYHGPDPFRTTSSLSSSL
jgi:hypothetical protein